MTETSTATRLVFPIGRLLHANEARLTAGPSPSLALAAYQDRAVPLATCPGNEGALFEKSFRKSLQSGAHIGDRADQGGVLVADPANQVSQALWQPNQTTRYRKNRGRLRATLR